MKYTIFVVMFSFSPISPQYFEYAEEAEWVVEVMKATGQPTAITMCVGPAGDSNNVPVGECAVRLARAGSLFPTVIASNSFNLCRLHDRGKKMRGKENSVDRVRGAVKGRCAQRGI